MPSSIARLNINVFYRHTHPRFVASVIMLLCLLCPFAAQSAMVETDDEELLARAENSAYGWLPKSEIPKHLHDKIPPGCNGIYVEVKSRDTSEQNSNLEQAEIIVEADEADIREAKKARLEGNVVVSHGDRSISADKMTYDRDADRANLDGGVVIREPGLRIQGDSAEVSTTNHKASFNEARFIMKSRNIRGSASAVKQVNADKIELHEGQITSCEPGDEAWILSGEKITVDKSKNQGTGKNVTLKIGKVPVFYLPYISFPVGDQRQTGVLFPSVGSSDDGGLDISIPYYLNLAPNYDATITPRFISGRGTMLELDTRYLNPWMNAEAGFAYLPNDGGNQDKDVDRLIEDGELEESQARPNKGKNRWLTQFQQYGGSTDGWYTRMDYTKVSDVDYFRDLGTSSFSVTSNTFLDQSFELGYQFNHWKLRSLAQTQQVLLLDVDAPYRKLPQIDVNGRYKFGDFTLNLNNQLTQFEHRDARVDLITGKRANTEYRLAWEKRFPFGFFVSELGNKSLYYSLDDSIAFNNETEQEFGLNTPQASLDMGLIFDHAPGNFTQTLEPRIFYLYRDYEDHSDLFDLGGTGASDINFDTSERTFAYGQLYRDSRFIGGDRLDDANQVTLGLTTRWDNNKTGFEMFSLSAGQIFHFEDRRVTLNGQANDAQKQDNSEFATELKINLTRRTQLYSNAIYDTSTQEVNRGSTGLNFASMNYRKLFNISYSYLRDPDENTLSGENSRKIDQVDTSWSWPLKPQWSAMGRVNYDFQNEKELESFIGFEYNDCCYRLRLLARRWLDSNIATLVDDEKSQYDQGIFLEIHFKGLGGSGAKTNSILNDGIFGYENREKLLH